MWIEQQDNNQRYEKKKNKRAIDSREDFFESKKLSSQTSNLLENLASEISKEFWIDISRVKQLISSSTSGSLDSLKNSIKSKNTINFSHLLKAIDNAKSQIESLSKSEIESLKDSLDTSSYNPDIHLYSSSKKILPKTILNKAYDPKNIWDELIWAVIWLIDTTEAIILFTYWLGKWILLTPYHIYLMITGKWEYNWFKNI